MCVDSIWRSYTHPMYRCLFVTPYENQVRLIFKRITELIDSSPLLKQEVKRIIQSPYVIEWKSGSAIIGFTTGAASGSNAASIRGQRADYIYLDEMDYMGEGDFDTVSMIAAERNDIGLFASSTPTGRRDKFYECCKDKSKGFSEHHHPSMDNPNWCEEMEIKFKKQMTELAYIHEILAEFGPEESGVFNKDNLDRSRTFELYAYDTLDLIQIKKIKELGVEPIMYNYQSGDRAYINPFRTMGVDWDKSGASSSIIILDYSVNKHKFQVIKRVEVPKSEYTYDNAVNLIVELNEIYNPSWIYVDRGAGEYQLERLHIIGEEQPFTGLKNKVKGFQFKQNLEIIDPSNGSITKEPFKPFMVNQLTICFERDKMILSPFDDVLYKQLIDYKIDRISSSGVPVYTSKNEHYVDALGLSYLAFVLEFPELTQSIKKPNYSVKMAQSQTQLGQSQAKAALRDLNNSHINPWKQFNVDKSDLRGDRQDWFKVNETYKNIKTTSCNWGSRSGLGTKNGGGRSMW